MKKCPFCAEEIQDEAIVCRYCGRDLESQVPKVLPQTASKDPNEIIHKVAGDDLFTYILYRNRLEMLRLGGVQTIFIRNITNIKTSIFSYMIITTIDGKPNKIHINGQNAITMKEKIMGLM